MPEEREHRASVGADDPSHWATLLAGETGEHLRRTLSALPLDVLSHYPPPKNGGLPFGKELAVLGRRLGRQSIQLHPSGLSRVYSALAPPRHRLLYRAFTLGEPVSLEDWESLLGAGEAAFWRRQGFLVAQGARARAAFRVVTLAGLRFVADAFAYQERFQNRVHIGKDTATLLDFLTEVRGGRLLDVGTGSGALLLAAAGSSRDAVGVDINERAVAVARFNAQLNDIRCDIRHGNVFEMPSLGRFDLITWNLPFHFFPKEDRATNVDGDGGELGIELTLKFVDALPSLLADSGRACLLTSSPTLMGGREVLVESLVERAPRLGLDIRLTSIEGLWSPSRRTFHRLHRIRRIDNVVLELRPGTGRLDRVAAPPAQRAVDWVQGLRYRLAR